MIDRDQLRADKQAECDARVEKLHREIPRLEEIARQISLLSIERIRSGVLQKNAVRGREIDQEVAALIAEKRRILAEHNLTMDVYKPQWNCPKCEDRGYIRPGELCSCYLQERLDEAFRQSGIPENMRAYSLDNFDVTFYNDPQMAADKVEKCRQFVRQLKDGQAENNIILLGDVGRGKTHLSIAMANAALANGKTVIYKRIDDLLDLIRQYKYDRDGGENQGEGFELEQLKTCDLLVIDDLGAETVTSFAINQLRIIIEERNMRAKPWIVNTNLDLNELQMVYGQRVADRLIEKAAIYRLDCAESIRLQKRKREMSGQ